MAKIIDTDNLIEMCEEKLTDEQLRDLTLVDADIQGRLMDLTKAAQAALHNNNLATGGNPSALHHFVASLIDSLVQMRDDVRTADTAQVLLEQRKESQSQQAPQSDADNPEKASSADLSLQMSGFTAQVMTVLQKQQPQPYSRWKWLVMVETNQEREQKLKIETVPDNASVLTLQRFMEIIQDPGYMFDNEDVLSLHKCFSEKVNEHLAFANNSNRNLRAKLRDATEALEQYEEKDAQPA